MGNVGGQTMQSIADATGRVAEKVQGLPASLTSLLSKAGAIGASTGVSRPVEQSMPEEPAPTSETQVQPDTQEFSITPEMMMEARMVLPTKEYAKLKDMYDIQESAKKTEGGGTEAQIARSNTAELIDSASTQLEENPNIKAGLIAGPLESILGQFNAGDQATLDFNTTVSNLAATIAKARGGTSFTPNEQAMLEKYSPKVGDSKQILVTKLAQLRKQFGGKK